MDDMPRPRKPYLHRYLTRHGNYIWYVRKPGAHRIRIHGEFGSAEFLAAYDAAIAGLPPPDPKKATSGSMAWLWDRYIESPAFKTKLSKATRRQRENIAKGVLKKIGVDPCASITKAEIIASRDARANTPAQARNFLDAMRGLFRWALAADHVKVDPTEGVPNPERRQSPGFEAWSQEDVTLYYARWPLGTRERVWIDILLFTGLRRGDAVRLGRQHVRDGVATIKTEKSGYEIEVNITILSELAATISAGPCADLAFICNEHRRPFTKESFGNAFGKAARAAGVKKSAHGVRKLDAATVADNGATEQQMMALFGWKDPKMAAHYAKTADRKRMGKDAARKLRRTDPLCAHPGGKVSTPDGKS